MFLYDVKPLHRKIVFIFISLRDFDSCIFLFVCLKVCEECNPQRVYWRLFDVTEKTGLRRHRTDRLCHSCNGRLSDTIVHFGEKRELAFPQNWKAAFEHAKEADMILCLGSSLKVSRRFEIYIDDFLIIKCIE